ncbi:MAG: VWA domain-containing protein, partial [Bacteroidaceae bacterium]|nr:VWA domain-containing protein [Bacteroidaceae bacterium]
EMLYLLLTLPVLVGARLMLAWQLRRRLAQFGTPRLVRSLVSDFSRVRPWVKFTCMIGALALLIVMLARPQFGVAEVDETRVNIEMVIAVDVSNSMLAQDIEPSRLERARMFAASLIDAQRGDKIAIAVFAGEAWPQIPLTSDRSAAKMFLRQLTTQSVSLQGTELSKAVKLGGSMFSKEETGKALVIITDGENHGEDAVQAAREAAAHGVTVYVLGIGSTQGAEIPVAGGMLRDKEGQVVVTKLDEEGCKRVATAGGGKYFHIDQGDYAASALRQELSQLRRTATHTTYVAYNEQFTAFAVLALLLLVIEFFILETQNPVYRRWSKRLFQRK